MTGPFIVVRWWSKWSLQDVLDQHRDQPVFETEELARAEADRRNDAYAARHARSRRAVQPSLLDEASP